MLLMGSFNLFKKLKLALTIISLLKNLKQIVSHYREEHQEEKEDEYKNFKTYYYDGKNVYRKGIGSKRLPCIHPETGEEIKTRFDYEWKWTNKTYKGIKKSFPIFEAKNFGKFVVMVLDK